MARIVSRMTKNGKFRTETRNRPVGSDRFAVSTAGQNGATKLFLDFSGGDIRGGSTIALDGRQARTLYRLLAKHYG